MSRGLSTAIKTYAGGFWWAVKLTLRDATVKYYAQDATTFLGQAYEGLLKNVGGLAMSRGLKVDSAELEFLNADLTIGKLLESKAFEGAACELKLLLLGVEQEVLLATGMLTEETQGQETATFRMLSELDPSGIRVPERDFTIQCSWRFKSEPCGYVGVLTTCDKDFASCITRAQTHRFNAFPTLTPELEKKIAQLPGTGTYPPPGAGGPGDRRRNQVPW